MIYDSTKNFITYKGLYKNLDVAVKWLLENELSQLPLGRTSISGDEVYINRVDADTVEEEAGVYEYHRRYLDIHLDISGEEKVLFTETDRGEEAEAYHADGDYGLINGKKTAECIVDEGHFVICMLNEPHMPCVVAGRKAKYPRSL